MLSALLIANATPLYAECGAEKPLKIYVQKSYHAEKVTVPLAGCKTAEGACKASGTIFIVSTKKVKYKLLLVDGADHDGYLEVGEYYSAILSCGENPMMMPKNNDGKAISAFYVLEQEAEELPQKK